MDEMLKAIAVGSANDCAVAVAEHLCGTEEAFVERMNTRAKELGCTSTTFSNANGLDADGQKTLTSARDPGADFGRTAETSENSGLHNHLDGHTETASFCSPIP